MEFSAFFSKATGGNTPFPYQRRLAESESFPQLLSVPTGAGKTAAVVLSWLWRLNFGPEAIKTKTPRRLVYCLPMRVLVEQSKGECEKWLSNLEDVLDKKAMPEIHILMGGEKTGQWDEKPESPSILIGTQDMLLSRALNRGYGVSRFRWPIQFSLLHSDCLWIFDEIQLMGVGLKTSVQLEAFRKEWNHFFPAHSLWMSATLDEKTLTTKDSSVNLEESGTGLSLTAEDEEAPSLKKRMHAPKNLQPITLSLSSDTRKTYARELAESVLQTHSDRQGQTLVVMNTVQRAQDLYEALSKITDDKIALLLIHSRFRTAERNQQVESLHHSEEDSQRIIVTTQAIEAGVDISSKTLITELAPWDSMVQRFGRCNRYGEWAHDDPAHIYWIDISDGERNFLPYTEEELKASRSLLTDRSDACPASISEVRDGLSEKIYPVLRKKDLQDLFDTTPDLAGADIDVSRYIREIEQMDVQVFWRDLDEKPSTEEAAPMPDELCPVSIGGFRDFFLKKRKDGERMWIWDNLEGTWNALNEAQLRPGIQVMIPASSGGYTFETGWMPKSKKTVEAVQLSETVSEEGNTDDPFTSIGQFVSLSDHADDAALAMAQLLENLELDEALHKELLLAARYHDWGKAHPYFQQRLAAGTEEEDIPTGGPWAKSDRIRKMSEGYRPQFRHELASALAAIQSGFSDLAAYLIAAHHGKVRLSIRSMPDEVRPPEVGRRFARGIWEGESIPPCRLGKNEAEQKEIILDLELMELGRSTAGHRSWLERCFDLRETWGPFRLAYLESLVRIADWRASKKEQKS